MTVSYFIIHIGCLLVYKILADTSLMESLISVFSIAYHILKNLENFKEIQSMFPTSNNINFIKQNKTNGR